MHKLDDVDAASLRDDIPAFRAGDNVKVHVKVIEGTRARVQVFQGVVIRRHGGGIEEEIVDEFKRFLDHVSAEDFAEAEAEDDD